MHQAQLQVEKVRYHQPSKPRYNNPTFSSQNVWGSFPALRHSFSVDNLAKKHQNLPNITESPEKNQKIDNKSTVSTISRKINANSRHYRSQSNLKDYGSSSLPLIRSQISDKEIYQKQQKKYNIVTIQPKEYIDSIKIFPKFRLENLDEQFQKKLLIQSQFFGSKNKSTVANNLIGKKLQINPQLSPTKNIPKQQLRMKMLNNIDQVGALL